MARFLRHDLPLEFADGTVATRAQLDANPHLLSAHAGQRLVCRCTPSGVEMLIRHRQGRPFLANLPGRTHHHALSCPSYSPDPLIDPLRHYSGAALAHSGRTVALLGDLTFVHDSSGLLIGPTEPTPKNLTIVVSNDNGGGIFELLEQGDPRFSDVSSRIFGTPHDVDVGALCRAYHVEARQIEVGELHAALDDPYEGMRVLEVKADRSSLRQLHAAIKAAL